MIARGVDVNFGRGKLLLSAITAGHRLVVEASLKNKNVDINIKDRYGSNLSYNVTGSGDKLIAKALIDRGIKVPDCTRDPSPLILVIVRGHSKFVIQILWKSC